MYYLSNIRSKSDFLLHNHLEWLHTKLLVEVHSALVEAPNVEGDGNASLAFCLFFDVVIKRRSDVLTAQGCIDTKVVDVDGFAVAQRGVVFDLLIDAKRITEDGFGIICCDENRSVVIGNDGTQFVIVVFFVAQTKDIGASLCVNAVHLIKKRVDAANILFGCSSDVHTFYL